MANSVAIERLERVLDDFFQVLRVRFRFTKTDGALSAPIERLVFERGDSVGVLLYNPLTDEVVLAQQLRLPVYLRENDGWLIELVAGILDAGRTPEEVARSEALEEAGYQVDRLEHLATVYLSPGACTERIHLYLAEVRHEQRLTTGGGLAESGEDIRVLTLSVAQALEMVDDGRIRDAKTVIALQDLRRRAHRRPGASPKEGHHGS